MHDPWHWTMRAVADRVGAFLRRSDEFIGAWHELTRDRVGWIVAIDQTRKSRRERHGIALRHPFQSRDRVGVHESCPGKGGDSVDGHQPPLSGSKTGVHITWSTRSAPTASMARRSNPSAMPLASGMMASAARKSSSMG